jgi:hypothetical protein
MSIKNRLNRLEQRAAASGVGQPPRAQLWLPRNGRESSAVPLPSVEEQLAEGRCVIIYERGRDDAYLPPGLRRKVADPQEGTEGAKGAETGSHLIVTAPACF